MKETHSLGIIELRAGIRWGVFGEEISLSLFLIFGDSEHVAKATSAEDHLFTC